jgi:uncharacterized protein (TIGR03086 family)
MTSTAGKSMDLLERMAQGFALTNDVIGGLGDTPWDAPTPCSEWTLRQLVAHVILSTTELGRVATGQPVRQGVFADLDAVDVGADAAEARAIYEAAAAQALAAFGAPGGLDGMRPCPMGDLPATVVAELALSDALVHAWDIGRSIGEPITIPDELAEPSEAFLREMARDARRARFFAPSVAVSAGGASASGRLIAFTGRHPGR